MLDLPDEDIVSTKRQSSSSTSASGFMVDVDPDQISNPVLKRLLDEVRNDSACCPEHTYAYDRVHNRHNRGR